MNKFIWGAYFLTVVAATLSHDYGGDITTVACVAVAFMLGLCHD
ncbi:hypothetical protein [Pseudomonas fluorescens]|nr:hypothetical protein [Pseudomonas fluorescens]